MRWIYLWYIFKELIILKGAIYLYILLHIIYIYLHFSLFIFLDGRRSVRSLHCAESTIHLKHNQQINKLTSPQMCCMHALAELLICKNALQEYRNLTYDYELLDKVENNF